MQSLTIDGNYLEGGGQIVRTALALSTLTGIPCSIHNIRGGRPRPGLKAQHLTAANALEALCGASTAGLSPGSTALEFQPAAMAGRTLSLDIGTAGAITLLLQNLLLPCCFSDTKVRLKIKGGTDVKWSMPWDYLAHIVLPHLEVFTDCKIESVRRGYFPAGGGKIDIVIRPKFHRQQFATTEAFLAHLRNSCPPLSLLERGDLIQVKGISHAAAELKRGRVAERQANSAKQVLKELGVKIDITCEYCETICPGSGITLWADFQHCRLGGDALGEKGKRAETVGREAAELLLREITSGAVVDRHLADNLVPIMGLLGGSFKTSEISDHTLTNIYVTEQFLPVKFAVKDRLVEIPYAGPLHKTPVEY